jgi:hypothetical protein
LVGKFEARRWLTSGEGIWREASFEQERMVICELVHSCAETKLTEHVLIPRLCRLE